MPTGPTAMKFRIKWDVQTPATIGPGLERPLWGHRPSLHWGGPAPEMPFLGDRPMIPLLGLLLALSPGPTPTRADDHPNVVIIYADDLGYADIGPFGATRYRT